MVMSLWPHFFGASTYRQTGSQTDIVTYIKHLAMHSYRLRPNLMMSDNQLLLYW